MFSSPDLGLSFNFIVHLQLISLYMFPVLTGAGSIRSGWSGRPSRVWGACWIPGGSGPPAISVERAPAAGTQEHTQYWILLHHTVFEMLIKLTSVKTPSVPLDVDPLWTVGGPCGRVRVSHHCHSGAVRPQQRLQTSGQLQLLPGVTVLHGQRPRLHTLSPGHGHSLQKGQRLQPRGHAVCF